jgi:hypothetical protein
MAKGSSEMHQGMHHTSSHYKLKKLVDDETLNHICLDRTLFHLPKSHGSYFNARTG